MKKKIALLLVGVIASASLLAACGGNNNSSNNDTETTNNTQTEGDSTETAEDITFRFSWWGDDSRHAATQEIIDLYVSENPNVTIEPHFAPWSGFQDQFAIALEGGQEADLMQVNYNWLELYSPDGTTFLDLATVSDVLTLSNWNAEYIDMTTVNGAVQAVPTGITARIPFINSTVYANAGITELPTTWDELMAAGRQIQAELGEEYFALSPLGNPAGAYLVFAYLEQTTGLQFVDGDNNFQYTLEDLEAGFQFYQDLIDSGVVTLGGFDSDPINQQNPMWIQGHYGGVTEWDSSINGWLSNIEEGNEVVVAPFFSTGDDKLSGLMSRPSMGFAISRNSKHPEAVAAFLEFMLTDERAIEIMGTDRGVPSNNVAFNIFQGLSVGGLVVEAAELVADSETTVMRPIYENPSVREIYEVALSDLQNGITTVEEAAANVYNRVQATIDSEIGR